MRKSLFYVVFFVFFLHAAYGETTIETVWGPAKIDHPLLEALIQSPVLQRLKKIDQSGPLPYFSYMRYFSRYEHSVGVLALLARIKAPLVLQATGLLHDTSHTAFSHVGDHLFYKDNQERCYQDLIHLDYLKAMNVPALTEEYGFELEDLDPDRKEYAALERPLPELCADRIQYLVHTGVICHRISKADALEIIEDLNFKDGFWFFTDVEIAKTFASLSLYFTRYLWGAEFNYAVYSYFTILLQYAIQKKIITEEDLRFKDDHFVFDRLKKSNDPWIKKLMKMCDREQIASHYKTVPCGQGKWNVTPKFRGVDPRVRSKNAYKRLSELDPSFKNEFEATQKWCKKGFGIIPIADDFLNAAAFLLKSKPYKGEPDKNKPHKLHKNKPDKNVSR